MAGAPMGVMLVDWFGGPGGDRLSRGLSRSIMGAGGFHGRVRDGIGCGPSAMATRSSKPKGQVLLFVCGLLDECCGGLADALASARGVEPIGRLGPVGTGIAAVAPLAYRRAGLARP